ncbi:MAG: hypothetical protein R3F59_15665 [Myxococcota bacterium]
MEGALVVVAALLAGCDTEIGWPGGTGVGNPGSTSVQSRLAGDVYIEEGFADLDQLEVVRCPPEDAQVTDIGREIDLLGDGPFAVAGGEWCTVALAFSSPLVYRGLSEPSSDPNKGSFELILDVGRIEMPAASGVVVDGGAYVIELGRAHWLEKDRLGGLEDGTHVTVDETHPLYADLVDAIAFGSAVFRDADANGILDATERLTPLAAGPDWTSGGGDDDDDR